jgi:DNA polymerase-1
VAFIFDIETDGLLQECTRAWIVGYLDTATNKIHRWLWNEEPGWKQALSEAKLLVGHNAEGFDIPALEKVAGWIPSDDTARHDTLLMSQVLNYKRFGSEGHSLEVWGQHLGSHKGSFNPENFKPAEGESVEDFWKRVGDEMITYWEQDLRLTARVYNTVLAEFKDLAGKRPQIIPYLQAEHYAARWAAQAELKGWPFDIRAAEILFNDLTVEMEKTKAIIMPKLGFKAVAIDKCKGVVEAKKPKWTKIGAYAAHTANWFKIDPYTGQDMDRLVEGEYSRVEIVPLDLDSVDDVKIFLYRHGWEPTEYNYVKDKETGERRQTSGKITEDSLECMEGDGKLYCDFLTTKSRHGILKGWLDNVVRSNPFDVKDIGMLHGGCMVVGTPSMRARHSGIVNVPAAENPWGKEMRSLFTCFPGWKLIGADSAGNQARGLAHYLDNAEFTNQLLNGDIHTFNAGAIEQALNEMSVSWNNYLRSINITEEEFAKKKRATAKRILYAFLFGAGGDKLWSYIFSIFDKKKGNKFKRGFQKAVPGFEKLLEKLEKVYGSTSQFGDGYIIGIAGNRIYVDSFHKLLVYLLQACEKATCAAALMLTMKRLKEAGIEFWPCIFMHDEIDFMVKEEHVEQAAVIAKQSFIDGPKLFGITIMDGEAKVGMNWYEVH